MMMDEEARTGEVRAEDYRLPTTVAPQRYEIRLTPDLQAFTFAGEETIDIQVNEPVTEIVLNALELEIDSAAVECDGQRIDAAAEIDVMTERARLRFARAVTAGNWRLQIKFRGLLNDQLHGTYRTPYQDS